MLSRSASVVRPCGERDGLRLRSNSRGGRPCCFRCVSLWFGASFLKENNVFSLSW